MRSKALLSLAVLAGLVATAAFSQIAVKPSGSATAIDGKVSSGEYATFAPVGGIGFGASLSADGSVLSLVVQAPTAGWVAIGLGARLMDGAYMLLAYDAAGKPSFSEQLGAGHFHKPVSGASKILASAVLEAGGSTTLEVQVRAADFAKGGKLPLIMAYGKADDFVSRHQRYAMTGLSF